MLTQLSVTTAATNRKLTQVATVKTELQITATTDDTFLGTLIAQASAAIEAFCGRVFAAQTYSETQRLDSYRQNLLLAQYPVVRVVTVTEAGTALVGASDWETYSQEGILARILSDRAAYWQTLDRIVVAYVAGYSLPGDTPLSPTAADALPYDIERACIELVKTAYLSRTRNANVQREDVPDVYSVSYATSGGGLLSPGIAAMLAPYRDLRAF